MLYETKIEIDFSIVELEFLQTFLERTKYLENFEIFRLFESFRRLN